MHQRVAARSPHSPRLPAADHRHGGARPFMRGIQRRRRRPCARLCARGGGGLSLGSSVAPSGLATWRQGAPRWAVQRRGPCQPWPSARSMTKSRGPSGPSCASETPDALPVLPLRETVVFPLTIAPVSVDREPLRKLVEDATRGNRLVALAAVRESDPQSTRREDLYAFATAAIVHEALRGPDNVLRVAVQGLARVRIVAWVQTEPYLVARVHWMPE